MNMAEDMSKWVTFVNGRIKLRGVGPMIITGFRDKYNRERRFADVPLYTENGELETTIDAEGKAVTATWGQPLKFVGGKRSLKLHSEVHRDVIQAIRNLDITVSSQKDDWAENGIVRGKIIEVEPEKIEEREFDEVAMNLTVAKKLIQIGELYGTHTYAYLMTLCGLKFTGNERTDFLAINKYANDNKEHFYSLFEEDDDEVVIKPDLINEAIVALAISKGVIQLKSNGYFFGDISLGASADKIPSEHYDKVGSFKAAIDRKLKLSGGPDNSGDSAVVKAKPRRGGRPRKKPVESSDD
jgi:hypothetical protein